MPMRTILVLSALSLFVAAAADAAPVVVDHCGQVVMDGVLAADLDCSADSGFAVVLANGGSLDLAGHRLTGTSTYGLTAGSAKFGGGVHCLGDCTVHGGEIVGPAGAPQQSWYSVGIFSDWTDTRSSLHLQDATVRGWSTYGILFRIAEITNSHFEGNFYGIVADKWLEMSDSSADGNGEGAHMNTGGHIVRSSFDRNRNGVYVVRSAKFEQCSAANNETFGVAGRKVRFYDSSLDGNCTDSTFRNCADVFVRRHPRLVNTSCATSINDVTERDWNVCSDD